MNLDIGCGENKNDGFVGMDCRELEGVDIVHDVEVFPWPIDNEKVDIAVCSHLVEHISPKNSIPFMDEVWRILKPGCTLAIATPYAGSPGFWQDPTHCNGWSERTWDYFDPGRESGLYNIYEPKPWEIMPGFPVWHQNGNLEVVLKKRSIEVADLNAVAQESANTEEVC